MIRRILAVIAGFALWSILWLCCTTTLQATGLMPSEPHGLFDAPLPLLILLVASVVCSLASGWLTACIVGQSATKPVLILAAILLAVGVLVQGLNWDKLPLWYHLPFLALLVPATVMGGRLCARGASGASGAKA